MDSRSLTTLLSSLISQLLLLLLILFPSNPNPNTNLNSNFTPLIHHFLTTSQITLTTLSRKRKRTIQNDNNTPTFTLPKNPDSFKNTFKMSSTTFQWLSSLLEPLLDCRDPVDSPINLPADTRLAIGLLHLATGADYADVSTRFGVSEPTARFCVKQLCRVLCTNFRFWVGFPNSNELQTVSALFESLTGLPNCCGVIKCFRIGTVRVQIVVDTNHSIMNIVAGCDKGCLRILKSSALYKDVESGVLLNAAGVGINDVFVPQYLVGDADFPLLPWLMVPFVDPVGGHLNDAMGSMQGWGNRVVASLRNWGVLSVGVETDFKSGVAYIGACSILHNALLMREDYSALSDEVGDSSMDDQRSKYYDGEGTIMEENSKALDVRNALATRARNFSKVDHNSVDPSTSMQF